MLLCFVTFISALLLPSASFAHDDVDQEAEGGETQDSDDDFGGGDTKDLGEGMPEDMPPGDGIHQKEGKVVEKKKEEGDFFEYGEFAVLDTALGIKSKIKLRVGEVTRFKNLDINLQICWQQRPGVYRPEAEAMLEMVEVIGKKAPIFSGWIFSNHHSLSLPRYNNYVFFLRKCEKSK